MSRGVRINIRIITALLFMLPTIAAAIEGRATVIDGDTIAVEGTAPRIRLDAIDAPESSQPCFDAAGARYLCGTRAAETLAAIIGRNGRVTCKQKQADRYGRIVAVCFAGSTDINREMVRRGWAIEFKRYSDGRYAGAEAEAKASKAGLWSGTFDEPAEWRKSQRVGEVVDAPRPAVASAPIGLMATTAAAVSKVMPTTSATSCKAASNCRDAVILWSGDMPKPTRMATASPARTSANLRRRSRRSRRRSVEAHPDALAHERVRTSKKRAQLVIQSCRCIPSAVYAVLS